MFNRINLFDSQQDSEVNSMFLPGESIKSESSFQSLSDVIRFVEKAYHDKKISKNHCLTLDGKYIEAVTNKAYSIEIKITLFEDISGTCNKIIVILKDTTERDILASLESTSKFKDNMLASVSHEIRTPLNGFRALIESALYDPEIPDDSKKQYLIPSLQSAEILNSIVDDILDYLMLTRKGLEMSFRTTNIIKIFEDCYQIMKFYTLHKNIRFDLQVTKEVPHFLRTDPNRLRQVILNLLSNAFKFTVEGHVKFVVAKEDHFIRITIVDSGKGMSEETQKKLTNILSENIKGEKINQHSSGIGLGLTVSYMISLLLGPNEKSGLCFESKLDQGSTFTFLIEDKMTESCSATATVNKISSKNGLQLTNLSTPKKSRISVESPMLIKSNFNIDEPIAESDSKDFSSPEGIMISKYDSERCIASDLRSYAYDFIASRGFQRIITSQEISHVQSSIHKGSIKCNCPEILVVDDEPMNILAMSTMIKRNNYLIDTALSGEIALQMYKTRKINKCSKGCNKYKLIFMDINMPGLDGITTTKKIREIEKKEQGNKSFIVACTAYLEQDYKQLCFNNGMDDFINKPVTQAKLIEIIKKYDCMPFDVQ